MIELFMKQKMFSFKDAFHIYDRDEQETFKGGAVLFVRGLAANDRFIRKNTRFHRTKRNVFIAAICDFNWRGNSL